MLPLGSHLRPRFSSYSYTMRSGRLIDRQLTLLGGRFPVPVVFLATLTLASTIAGAVGFRNGLPVVLELGSLAPARVWSGELWRLLTWSFLEPNPLSLVFACLVMLFIGRDLCYAWGPRRFIRACLGIVAGSGIVTCLIAVGWPGLMGLSNFFSAWPLGEAMIIVWAALYPSRQLLVYFVIPVGGRNLIYLTIGGTVLFALLGGIAYFVPHFVAEGFALAWAYGYTPRSLWLRLKLRSLQWTPKRRPTHLRPVERGEEPPRWLH